MSKKHKRRKHQSEYIDPNHRPKVCACCQAPVTVMCEWFDERGHIYCGSSCRRGKCDHYPHWIDELA